MEWDACCEKKSLARGKQSVGEERAKKTFSFISRTWNLLRYEERAAWEMYAKQNRKIKSKRCAGIVRVIGNWYSGRLAFTSVNLLLLRSGFRPLVRPLFQKLPPPPPATDLPEHSELEKEVKFKIWLPQEYEDKCTVRIWIKKVSRPNGRQYLMKVVPISSTPTEIKIERIRFAESKTHSKRKTVEKKFSDIGYCKLHLQMRTVAENGRFSVPSAIYTIELNREPLSTRELFSNKRVTDFLNTLQE